MLTALIWFVQVPIQLATAYINWLVYQQGIEMGTSIYEVNFWLALTNLSLAGVSFCLGCANWPRKRKMN